MKVLLAAVHESLLGTLADMTSRAADVGSSR
jgi:hypothetical protein